MSPEWTKFFIEAGLILCVFVMGFLCGWTFGPRIGQGQRVVVHSLDDSGVWTLRKSDSAGWFIEAQDGTWNRLYDPNWDTLEEEREFWSAVRHAADVCPWTDGKPDVIYPEIPLAFKFNGPS